MAKPTSQFECQVCGARSSQRTGKCGTCGAFDSWMELRVTPPRLPSSHNSSSSMGAISMAEVEILDSPRRSTGLGELDRVLGGGVVPGMVVLLGGEPGIGKSTLLLQWAAQTEGLVLYASGEESERQIKLRARRLGAEQPSIYLLAETDVDRILEAASKLAPALLLVDSIQTIQDPELQAAPGTVSQVRGCAHRLTQWSKAHGTPVVLVGHVTKEGHLAGPKVLEHLVDTVLAFEGDRHHHHRLLRSLKNRFGAAFELGVFAMTEKGLVAVEGNPFFLEMEARPGCATTVILSGTRPMVVEIQALVASAGLGIPRRTALGIDGNRLAMLAAVAERRGGVQLHDRDLYVNVAGGLEVEDPSADLAILAALVSSATGRLLPEKALFLGEVGLTGEIRPVSQLPLRLQEGTRLGFTAAAVPKLGFEGKAPCQVWLETTVERLRQKPWLLTRVEEKD